MHQGCLLRRPSTRPEPGYGHAGFERNPPDQRDRSQRERRAAAAASAWCCWSRWRWSARRSACCWSAAAMPGLIFWCSWPSWRWSGCSRCSPSPPASCASPSKDAGANPMLKAVVDEAADGLAGHRPARPRHLRQPRLSAIWSTPRTPTTCGRSSGCSSAIPMCRRRSIGCSRRRARAARPGGGAGRRESRASRRAGCGCACGRSASAARSRLTLWTVTDVTRDRERQENIFQELQHAIDYLDHAPAGFFSVDGNGDIGYLNATLAVWLDHDLAQVGSGGLKLADIVSGNGAALITTLAAAPGEVKTEVLDLDFKTRGGRTVPVRLFHKVAFGADGTPGASRTLVLNRASGETAPTRSAPPKCASCGSSSRRRWRSPPSTRPARSRAPMRCSPGCSTTRCVRTSAGARRRPFDPRRVVRSRPRAARDRDRQAADGQSDIAPVDAALGRRRRALRPLLRLAGRGGGRDAEAAIVYALETTGQRTLENQVNQRARMEIGRPARRRHRARLQQRALRHHDGDRFPAQRPQADRSVVPGHHADQAERQPGGEPGAATAGVLAASRPCGRRCSISARC